MTVARASFKKIRILAGALAFLIAFFTLVLALPNYRDQAPFHTAEVFADDGHQKKLTTSVQLSDALILEAGAIIKAQISSPKSDKKNNKTHEVQPHLHLKNATLTVIEATATTAGGQRARPPVKSNVENASLIAALRNLGFDALHLDNTLVRLKRPGGSLKRIGHITGIFVTGQDNTLLNAEGMFVRNGKTLRFTTQTGPGPRDTLGQTVKLDVAGADFKLSLDGKLFTKGGARITSDVAKFETSDLKHILEWLGMGPITSGGFRKFSAAGHVNWTGSTIAFDQSTFMIDGNPATGRLWFFFDSREPSVEGTLAFQKLELSPYLGVSDQPAATTALKKAWIAIQSTASTGALPLGLKEIDADIRLSAKSLEFNGTSIGSGAAVVLVKDGELKADIADMTFAGGAKGRSQIVIDMSGSIPKYALHGNVNDFDLGASSASWFGKPFVDGIANMTFDLSAQGQNKGQLLSSLSGPIVISAENGASIPIDLVQLFARAKKTPNDGWQHVEGGFTALKDLSVELVSSQGALKTQSVKASLDGNALIATGSLKLTDLVLDLVLTKHVASDDPAGKKTASSTSRGGRPEVKDELEFKGPITEPIIRIVSPLHNG